MSVYINTSSSLPNADRGQAWVTVTSPRKTEGGTEYVEVSKASSGFLSGKTQEELLQLAAETVIIQMESNLKEAKAILKGMGLYRGE